MAIDSFTTTESFGKRLGNKLFGIVLGPVFVIGAAALIFWNEGRTVREADSLTAGASAVVEADPASPDPGREGKLVHLSGPTKVDGTLTDPEFGVTTPGIKLQRKVEVYEWTETSHSKDGKTTYDYDKKWQDHLIKSADFKAGGHDNPSTLAYEGKTFQAEAVNVGAFQLDPGLVGKIGGEQSLSLTADNCKVPTGAKLQPDGVIYVGKDSANPAVGDLRISEKVTPAGTVSVVAAQKGSKLATYQSSNGAEIALLEMGNQSAADMFKNAQSANKMMAWIWRLVSFVLLFIGIHSVFGPLELLASFIPILGAVFEGGMLLISFLLALVGWFVLVGAAWITARPMLAVPLLVVAFLGVSSLVWLLIKRHAARKARLMGGGGVTPMQGVG